MIVGCRADVGARVLLDRRPQRQRGRVVVAALVVLRLLMLLRLMVKTST